MTGERSTQGEQGVAGSGLRGRSDSVQVEQLINSIIYGILDSRAIHITERAVEQRIAKSDQHRTRTQQVETGSRARRESLFV